LAGERSTIFKKGKLKRGPERGAERAKGDTGGALSKETQTKALKKGWPFEGEHRKEKRVQTGGKKKGGNRQAVYRGNLQQEKKKTPYFQHETKGWAFTESEKRLEKKEGKGGGKRNDREW